MENITTILNYSDRGFGASAKKLLAQNRDFNVLMCGWRARVVISSLQPLMHLQGDKEEGCSSELGTYYTSTRFILLILLSPFMAIFWLAVANNKAIYLQSSNQDSVELSFRGKKSS